MLLLMFWLLFQGTNILGASPLLSFQTETAIYYTLTVSGLICLWLHQKEKIDHIESQIAQVELAMHLWQCNVLSLAMDEEVSLENVWSEMDYEILCPYIKTHITASDWGWNSCDRGCLNINMFGGSLTGIYIDRFNKVWNHGAWRKAGAINGTMNFG